MSEMETISSSQALYAASTGQPTSLLPPLSHDGREVVNDEWLILEISLRSNPFNIRNMDEDRLKSLYLRLCRGESNWFKTFLDADATIVEEKMTPCFMDERCTYWGS